ncbi:hypothetical protein ANCCEY_11373 [Ancylostoma ceylanicum]|uniref:Uncharacterized protein n=1 Tax=Ancylostoma ceylanicum TaxID=53326 RepID=A0A0D6LHX8_9BILA|nr:hypothetical protein ANCCEY_11373 [Ancylostoma ceylanicum]
MVPTALFSSFGEEDYNQEDSGDDSDSEEPSEPAKEEAPAVEEPKKDGGASASGLLINSTKGDDATASTNPLLSFPFQFNFQQLMESAALGAQITNTSE